MAQYHLLLPKMGESVAEATIVKWVKKIGEKFDADDTVAEIATDKVDSEVPSPVAGKLVKYLFNENDVAPVGATIAIIETEDAEAVPAGGAAGEQAEKAPPYSQASPVESPDIPGISQVEVKEEADRSIDKGTEYKGSARFYSPLVKSIAAEEGISLQELDIIKGTGAEGRVTKNDILDYVKLQRTPDRKFTAPDTAQRAPEQQSARQLQESDTELVSSSQNSDKQTEPAPFVAASVSGHDEIIEMDRMRKMIAEHMVKSKQTSPHVTSFVEADLTNVVKWRDRVKQAFEKREGEKITFTPIFIEAVAKAIKDFPMINVSVNGTQIIKKRDINIALATALPSGNLIVPVIRNADQLNLVGLTRSVNDLAKRARNNKLFPDEVKDGTFTLTNIGSFGNDMGIPIINQPQVAILAVGTIKKKPAVIETEYGDMIGIRHMMFLSLSYDHRVVDGALGGSFVKRVADYLENWDIHREI